MTDLIAMLAAANPDLSDDPLPPLDAVWRKLDSAVENKRRASRSLPAPAWWRPRGRERWATVGVATAAAAAALLVFGITGSGPASAFAGWTANPTPAAANELHAAEAACGSDPTLASLSPTLSDTRGPYSMLVFAGASSTTICIARLGDAAGGVGASSQAVAPTVIGQYGAVATSSIAPGKISPHAGIYLKPKNALFSGSSAGQGLRVLTGQVGPDVTAVTLVLNDGSSVEATTENGWFAAWWPSLQGVQSANVTTATGTATQPLNVPTLTTRAPL